MTGFPHRPAPTPAQAPGPGKGPAEPAPLAPPAPIEGAVEPGPGKGPAEPAPPAPPAPIEGVVVPRELYRRDSRAVAPELLGKLLVRWDLDDGPVRAGRIVEVEAYRGSEDPGSHAYRGETQRNRTMFGPPGRLYVYFTYGMHWCANAVCGDEGQAMAVLLRALAPVAGLEAMRAARPRARRDRDLCSGPAKLCQALGLDRAFDGADLVTADRGLMLVDDGTPPPTDPMQTTRIGLNAGAEHPWRWYTPGDPNVSGFRQPSRGRSAD